MIVAFRVDASNVIGTGHVMRCLSLAQRIKNSGDTVIFVCRELPGNLCDEIERRGFTTLRLKGDEKEATTFCAKEPKYAAWLGTTWQLDALQTCSLLKPLAPLDWLVVDHYSLGACWEKVLRPLAKKLMAIEDLFDRPHDVDILLNQNILRGSEVSYQGLLPNYCSQLLGPRYALLQDQYQELRNRIPPRSGKIGRILVYFGGVDAANLTGRSLEALIAAEYSELEIDVILPVAGAHRKSIMSLAEGMSGVKIHDDLPSLAKLMASADLAIGAGGTTSWERLCLGLPALIVTLADNQVMIAKSLQANDLAHWLGHHDKISIEDLANRLRPLLKEGLSPDWSARCRATVDGAGVDRIYELLTLSVNKKLSARHATIDDDFLAGDWATDSDFTHVTSYAQMLRSIGDNLLYMVEVLPGEIVGLVFCTYKEGFWTLSPQLSPRSGTTYTLENLQEAAVRKLFFDNKELKLGPNLVATDTGIIISICSDENSWINDFIPAWVMCWQAAGYKIVWTHDPSMLPKSQVCFYFGYSRIVGNKIRSRHDINLVVHESDLPSGRGWSPLTWQVLQGAQEIMVTLFEAVDAVDSGVIYGQTVIELQGHELISDLRLHQAAATFKLCTEFILEYPAVLKKKREQRGTPSYFQKRTPADSQIDVNRSLADQFNLLRVCDNQRYPAWFDYAGVRYTINISRTEKVDYEK